MSLLSAQDPRYWLAKIIATPAKSVVSRKAFDAIILSVGRASHVSAAALTELNSLQLFLANPNVFSSKSVYGELVTDFVSRYNAFTNKYAKPQTTATGDVVVPDLKADAIEMLTWAIATTDKIRSIYSWTSGVGAAYAAIATVASNIYEALAGAMKKLVAGLAIAGSVLVTAGLAGVGIWAYVQLKRPSYRR